MTAFVRAATGTLARHIHATLLLRASWLFLVVHVFVGVAGALALSFERPYVPIGLVFRSIPDVILFALPVSMPFVFLAAAVSCLGERSWHDACERLAVSGHDPRPALVPVLLIGGVVSAGVWWLNTAVVPRATYVKRDAITSFVTDPTAVALRFARDSELLRALDLEFDAADRGRLRRPRMLFRGDATTTAVVARSARSVPCEDRTALRLELDSGRLVDVNSRGVVGLNLRFGKLLLDFDVDRLVGPSKQDLMDARYYTNAELEALPELVELRSRAGLVASERDRRRVAAIPAVRATRLQSGLLSFLFLTVAVVILGRRRRRPRLAVAAVVILCSAVLLPQQLILDWRARKAGDLAPILGYLPSFEVMVLVAGELLASRWSRR